MTRRPIGQWETGLWLFDQFGPGCAVSFFDSLVKIKKVGQYTLQYLGSISSFYVIRSCFACVLHPCCCSSQLVMTQQQLNVPSSSRHLISYPFCLGFYFNCCLLLGRLSSYRLYTTSLFIVHGYTTKNPAPFNCPIALVLSIHPRREKEGRKKRQPSGPFHEPS